MNEKNQMRTNVLALGPVRSLLKRPAFPVALQILCLAGMGYLLFNGWGVGLSEPGNELMILRKTNLTTLFVWGLWWPGLIGLTLLLGRLWCTVCPMELVNRLADALSRRAGLPRARLGSWLRAGWLTVLLYLVLQFLVAGFWLHRVPHYTALMLVVVLGSALVTGLLFREPRSFCKAFCPAAALLSVYGRFTPLQLDIQDPETCARCETRDCVARRNRYRFDNRSCPSLLRPFGRTSSDGCVLCFQCAKVCPYRNVGFGLVRSEAGIRKPRLLLPYETAFVIIAAGFVTHELLGEVKRADEVFHFVPRAIQNLAPSIGFGWFEALWFLFLFPATLWLVVTGLSLLMGHRSGWKPLLAAAATTAAPVVALAHLAKSAAKVSSWAGHLPPALADPRGQETSRGIIDQVLSTPSPLVGIPVLGWIMLAGMTVLLWRSWQGTTKVAAESRAAARAGLAAGAVLFLAILSLWPWL